MRKRGSGFELLRYSYPSLGAVAEEEAGEATNRIMVVEGGRKLFGVVEG